MQTTLSMEGMDMDMGTPSCVWSILDPLVKLDQWEAVEEEEEVEVEEEDQEEGLDPQLEDLNSGS